MIYELVAKTAEHTSEWLSREGYYAEGPAFVVEGHLKLAIEIPPEDLRIESQDMVFDFKEPLDLSEKCSHRFDWETLDERQGYGTVKCRFCGRKGYLDPHKMRWEEKTDE